MTRVFVINNQDLPSIENIDCSDRVNHPTTQNTKKIHQDVNEKNKYSIIQVDSNDREDENKQTEDKSLEAERNLHYGKSRKRQENFKLIVVNGPMKLSWTKYISYPIAIPIVGFLPTIFMTLIPAHDLIQHPEYWYEILFHGLLQNTALFSYMSVLAASLFNLRYIIQRKNVFAILLIGNVTCLCLLVFSYFNWTNILDYHFPIPHLGFTLTTIMVFSSHVVIWRNFPSDWRRQKEFRKRMMFYLLYFLYTAILGILYQIMAERIRLTNVNYQPIAALALPVTREISVWIGMKFLKKFCSGDERGAQLFLQYTLSARHAIVVGSFILSIPNESVSLVLMHLL